MHGSASSLPTVTVSDRALATGDACMLSVLVEEARRRAARTRPGGHLCDIWQLPGDLEAPGLCRELRPLSRGSE
eukprot:scaffold9674_cov66-Phaeocystis_antarctica.AAC.5